MHSGPILIVYLVLGARTGAAHAAAAFQVTLWPNPSTNHDALRTRSVAPCRISRFPSSKCPVLLGQQQLRFLHRIPSSGQPPPTLHKLS